MKKIFLILLAFSGAVLAALDVTASFQIVNFPGEGGPEKMAAPALAKHLEKVFGKKMVIVERSKADLKKPSIILERDKKLDLEEWSIKAEKNHLYIRGGFPRGVFYGVCEFLERFAGVRWFSAHEIKTPKAAKVTVPNGKTFRGKPAFPLQRNIGDSIGARMPNYPHVMFKAYNRQSYFPNLTPDKTPGSYFRSFTHGSSHTFYKLTKAVPKGKEYMLPLSKSGHRIRSDRGLGPGQICFSNKEFREFSKKEIAKWIAEGDARYKKRGYKLPVRLVDLSQNDNNNFCQCEGCLALYNKYNSISGAMLEFVNDIASAFPDRYFQTFSYGPTVTPPVGIKARDNVLIHFAFLGADILRPLSGKNNAPYVRHYKKWDKIAKNKAIWAYHRAFSMTEQFEWPQCCFWYIGEDMRFYHNFGMQKFYLETEAIAHGRISLRAFHDLHVYLATRLAVNPNLNDKELIEEYMDSVYGPAAPEMKAYAAYLKKRYEAIPGRLNQGPLPGRAFFDDDYFRTIKGFLDRAEAKARKAKNMKLVDLVTLERLSFNLAALNMWNRFGKAMGGDREKIAKQVERGYKIFQKRYLPVSNRLTRELIAKSRLVIDSLRTPMPVPPGMEKLDIIQLPMATERDAVSDKDAWKGRALKCRPVPANSPYAHHKHLLQFGVYDNTDQRAVLHKFFMPWELKQDEKYHLYSLGRFVPNVVHDHRMWGHVSWAFNLGRVLRQAINPLDPGRELEVFISMKVTGPAYVKNSKKPNDIFVDKIIVVKHGIVNDSKTAKTEVLPAAKGKVLFHAFDMNSFMSPCKGLGPMGPKNFVILRGCKAFSKELFKYDPSKIYRLTCSGRIVSEKQGTLFIGLAPYDAKKRPIMSRFVLHTAGSETLLAAPAAKGAKVIMLKDCSKWNPKASTHIAFNVKADRSDLPNSDLAAVVRRNGWTQKGNVWEVKLAKPLAKSYPAGTAVRQHRDGTTYIYVAQKKLSKDTVILNGGISSRRIWPGTAYFRVMALFLDKSPKAVAEFRNFTCSAE